MPAGARFGSAFSSSFENAPRKLNAADEKQFKADKSAWKFFQQQPPGCQRLAIWWVVSGEETGDARRTAGSIDCRITRPIRWNSGVLCLATLAFGTESRWDSPIQRHGNADAD